MAARGNRNWEYREQVRVLQDRGRSSWFDSSLVIWEAAMLAAVRVYALRRITV